MSGEESSRIIPADHDAFHEDVLQQIHLAVDELHEAFHGKRIGEADDGSGVLYSLPRRHEADAALTRILTLMELTYDFTVNKARVGKIFGQRQRTSVLRRVAAATALRLEKLEGKSQREACRLVAEAAGSPNENNDGDSIRKAIDELSEEDRQEALSDAYAALFTLDNIRRFPRKPK